MVTARKADQRTEYTSYFFVPESKQWKKLVTFSTLTGGRELFGYYAFVEDFRRNRVSATQQRKAVFGNGWVKAQDDRWIALGKARFTADSNPVTNIDAGPTADRFFLATGGETKNATTQLREMMEAASKESAPPADILPIVNDQD